MNNTKMFIMNRSFYNITNIIGFSNISVDDFKKESDKYCKDEPSSVFIRSCLLIHGKDKFDFSEIAYKNSRTPVAITCKTCGERFLAKPAYFIRGQYPTKHKRCSGVVDVPIIDHSMTDNAINSHVSALNDGSRPQRCIGAIRKHMEKFGNRFDYSEYDPDHGKLVIKCKFHGTIKEVTTKYDCVKRLKCCCKKCNYEIILSKIKTPFVLEKEFERRVAMNFPEIYNLTHFIKDSYAGMDKNMAFMCIKCGHKFHKLPSNMMKGQGCPRCSKVESDLNKRKKYEEVVPESEKMFPYIDFSAITKKNWCGISSRYNFKCMKCGHKFNTSMLSVVSGLATGCEICSKKEAGKAMRISYDEFINRAKEIHEERYEYNDEWNRKQWSGIKNSTITAKCDKHGWFEVNAQRHVDSHKEGCKRCSGSRLEYDFFKELRKNGLKLNDDFFIEKTMHGMVGIGGGRMRFDFYFHSIRTVVEIDGPHHFIESKITNLEKTKENDKLKDEYCRNNDIKIIRIRFDEFRKSYKETISELVKCISGL